MTAGRPSALIPRPCPHGVARPAAAPCTLSFENRGAAFAHRAAAGEGALPVPSECERSERGGGGGVSIGEQLAAGDRADPTWLLPAAWLVHGCDGRLSPFVADIHPR
eukprot:365067-Chlamydomonas_euryale.AAC.23